jgi:hypothetical protein
MLGTKAAITVALACSLASGLRSAILELPFANVRLALRFHPFATNTNAGIEFALTLGAQRTKSLPSNDRALTKLAQSLESLRDSAIETVGKLRHIA